jgi:IclR family pca regulon transcriptional regulator
MSRSTTHRYVLTLTALGYLEQQASRKYRLSHRAADIGMTALNSIDVRRLARPLLDELRESTSSALGLAVRDGAEIVYVDRAGSSQSVQTEAELGVGLGSRLPVHCTAMGKLLLAYLPEGEQRIVMAETNLPKHAPHTITSKRQLREELEEIRGRGFTVNNSEFAAKHCAIAAPVRDEARNVVAAISLADQLDRPAAKAQSVPHLRGRRHFAAPRLPSRRRVTLLTHPVVVGQGARWTPPHSRTL